MSEQDKPQAPIEGEQAEAAEIKKTKAAPRRRVATADKPRLPLLPLRDVVVFPHMVIPLFVGR